MKQPNSTVLLCYTECFIVEYITDCEFFQSLVCQYTQLTLQISGYAGEFGDQLAGSYSVDGMYFTTIDEDHDLYPNANCAVMMKGNQ